MCHEEALLLRVGLQGDQTPLRAAPHSWLPLERGKLSMFSGHAAAGSSIDSLMKMPEPAVLPHFKPADAQDVAGQTRGRPDMRPRRPMVTASGWSAATAVQRHYEPRPASLLCTLLAEDVEHVSRCSVAPSPVVVSIMRTRCSIKCRAHAKFYYGMPLISGSPHSLPISKTAEIFGFSGTLFCPAQC